MTRPKTINPNGEVVRVAANVSQSVADDLRREAKKRHVTVSQVMRERLER